ncbi:MAG: hypothetical protein DMF56_10690 [Acidobacteria bacterium]|nr:MAG: hypothetical protein DMF56_10690 [Acidobacteriota bacterium]
MATTADFVGTWYFRGYPAKPCTIRLASATRLHVRDEWGKEFDARVDGSAIIAENQPGYPTGVITSDLQTIQWSNGEPWKRTHS